MTKLTGLLITSLLVTSTSHAIVNGKKAHQDAFPTVVRIDWKSVKSHKKHPTIFDKINNYEHHRCTGTLIAPRVVLTAAHCLVDYNERYSVNGPNQMDSAYGKSKIKSVKYSSSYKAKEVRNDIGIIVLEKGLFKGPFPKIGCENPNTRERYLAVGYGMTATPKKSDGNYSGSFNSRKHGQGRVFAGHTYLRDISSNSINSEHSVFDLLGKKENSAVINGGDSGGPLFNENADVIYGIANSGTPLDFTGFESKIENTWNSLQSTESKAFLNDIKSTFSEEMATVVLCD